MKTAAGILFTSLLWAVIWGTLGYIVVLVSAFFNPDFGHVGPQLTSFVMAGVGLLSGLAAGFAFVLVAWARSMTGRRARLLLGAGCGAVVGMIPSISGRHWYLQFIAITAPLGALSALCSAPPRRATSTQE